MNEKKLKYMDLVYVINRSGDWCSRVFICYVNAPNECCLDKITCADPYTWSKFKKTGTYTTVNYSEYLSVDEYNSLMATKKAIESLDNTTETIDKLEKKCESIMDKISDIRKEETVNNKILQTVSGSILKHLSDRNTIKYNEWKWRNKCK